MSVPSWPSLVISKQAARSTPDGDAPGEEKTRAMDDLDRAFDAAIESRMGNRDGEKVWTWEGPVGDDGQEVSLVLPDPFHLSRRRYDIQGALVSVTLEPQPAMFEEIAALFIARGEEAERLDRRWATRFRRMFAKDPSPELRAHRQTMAARFLANVWIEAIQSTLQRWTHLQQANAPKQAR